MSHITNSVTIAEARQSLMIDHTKYRFPVDPNGHIVIGNIGRTSGHRVSQSMPMEEDHDTKCSLNWDLNSKNLCQD